MSKFRLTVEVDDLGDLTRTVQALEAIGADPGGVDAPTASKGNARKKAGKKAGKKAAAKAKPEPAASAIDDLIGGGDDEPEARTKDEVMQMFQRVGEEHGDDIAPAILSILQEHGCEKLSDLTDEHYASVYASLEALLAPAG